MLLLNHLFYSAVFRVEFEKKAPPHTDQPIHFHLLKRCLQSWSYHWSRSSSWSHLVLPQHLYHLHILLHKQKKPKDLNWQCWWGTIKTCLLFSRLVSCIVLYMVKKNRIIMGKLSSFHYVCLLVHYVQRITQQQEKKVRFLFFNCRALVFYSPLTLGLAQNSKRIISELSVSLTLLFFKQKNAVRAVSKFWY